jgi:hypothetical protein
VRSHIFQLGRLVRLLMQQQLDAGPFARLPIDILFRPLGLRLDDERFTIRVKFVGHVRFTGMGEYVRSVVVRILAYPLTHDASSILEPQFRKKVPIMSTSNSQSNGNSGKRLIVAILGIALLAAGASWWFRYAATHRTVEFWSPAGATLIRDAPRVTLRSYDPSVGAEPRDDAPLPVDISQAKGLIHLRNALLQDRSYDWSNKPSADQKFESSLVFEVTAGAEPRLVILFSPDFNYAASGSSNADPRPIICCRPMADALRKFFADTLADANPKQ